MKFQDDNIESLFSDNDHQNEEYVPPNIKKEFKLYFHDEKSFLFKVPFVKQVLESINYLSNGVLVLTEMINHNATLLDELRKDYKAVREIVFILAEQKKAERNLNLPPLNLEGEDPNKGNLN